MRKRHQEFQAVAFKYFVRQDQIKEVSTLVNTNQEFQDEASEVMRLHSEDLKELAAGVTSSTKLREALQKSNVAKHVRKAMYHVTTVMRKVEGTDGARHKFHKYFESLRIFHGSGVLFFTLNPRDVDSALTVRYMAEGLWKHDTIRLDLDEMAVHTQFEGIRSKSPTALHDMISEDTVAACECFHLTVRLVIAELLRGTDAHNVLGTRGANPLPPDGYACRLTPGMASFVSWYLGITEPQLRKSLHLHAKSESSAFAAWMSCSRVVTSQQLS